MERLLDMPAAGTRGTPPAAQVTAGLGFAMMLALPNEGTMMTELTNFLKRPP
jgi:hypothetical protein